ncbi:hypothetical protein K440DRAFT_105188 [Wilcoxina mikolae CBS 423.85]|nr:hypothetical protein K440DRAFT_105188 [Wilcoxina mikolae CBS 423.85]
MSVPTFGSMRFLLLRPCPFPTFSSFSARSQFRRNYAKASKKVKPLQQKVKDQAKAPKTEKNAATTSISTTAAVLQQYVPLEAKLAQAGKETLLYKKVHGRFLIATYGLVAACFGFVVINYRTGTTDTPPGVPAWVGKTHWVTMALVGGIGIGVAMYPTRFVCLPCV